MSIFEHIIVYVSIVIGLAVAQLLGGVVRVLSDRKARPYWVHLAWVFNVLSMITYYWWFTFDWQSQAEWTYQLYSFVFAYAMVMYLIAATLVPPAELDHGDYEEFFYARSRLFFSLLSIRAVVDLGDTYLTGGEEFSYPLFFPIFALVLALYVLGATTKNRRVHAVLAAAFTLLTVSLWTAGGGAAG